jgi:hypothetical protein
MQTSTHASATKPEERISLSAYILESIIDQPGITGSEMMRGVPSHLAAKSVSARLAKLKQEGIIEGGTTTKRSWSDLSVTRYWIANLDLIPDGWPYLQHIDPVTGMVTRKMIGPSLKEMIKLYAEEARTATQVAAITYDKVAKDMKSKPTLKLPASKANGANGATHVPPVTEPGTSASPIAYIGLPIGNGQVVKIPLEHAREVHRQLAAFFSH